ncbi:conserved hypothetical protein [Theileria equi strain WA]|uniref:Uncharacterized protein n=1 Tax=Theileria equi strain WA TaxID=1537102 RepID=L1LA59_THEEQ|nr:conserved hypothetical protein [Theileria equi strain WA]EKX72120.1 conserved hypothetical protein [Theileria equi strain WA]|eukprot:XP_004831572.1 conserved hypothetical protein [Theileria equi strain WA]
MKRILFWMRMDEDYNELIEGELESVALLNGLDSNSLSLSYSKSGGSRLFGDELKEFYRRLGEVCAEEENLKEELEYEKEGQNIFIYGNVPSEDVAKEIFGKCVLIKAIVEIWAESKSHDSLLETLLITSGSLIDTHLSSNKKWSFKLSRYNNKSTYNDLVKTLDKLSPIFKKAGQVDLANPDTKMLLLERYLKDKDRHKYLEALYFGRIIADRNDISHWWNEYSLSTRPVLGPTSLENTLSFVMCNMGLVGKNSIIYDPFVGSGGSIISSSILGSFCMGSDIDIRILRGWGIAYRNINLDNNEGPTDIFTNFDHYGLERPEIVRFDIKHPVWRRSGSHGWVDAIITDPPYGNRASAKHTKIDKSMKGTETVEVSFRLIVALLDLAEDVLVKGGRLVFLLPAFQGKVRESLSLLNRKRLEVKHIGQQKLAAGASRFVVAMEKL